LIGRVTILGVSTVYVVGAGASHGESLVERYPEARPHRPPLTCGFFDNTLLSALGYTEANHDLGDFISYVRETKLWPDPFGEGRWQSLDLEEVFTALEVEREFHNPESDAGARLLLLRNALVRHIRRVLGLCTLGARGEYYHLLADRLAVDDSVVAFNWDLLMDQEFIEEKAYRQYGNFLHLIPLASSERILPPFIQGEGLFLKLHGSLNWFRCGNRKCRASQTITFFAHPQLCLKWNAGDEDATCQQCGSVLNPVIIPPLLRKPITEDPVIRCAWGLPKERLSNASRVVVIGFSAAPTDFYTSWLLRSTVGAREDVEIEVINPCNDEGQTGHDEFKRRMDSIFLKGYGSKLCRFAQIASTFVEPGSPAR
jgi:hypothetical protein